MLKQMQALNPHAILSWGHSRPPNPASKSNNALSQQLLRAEGGDDLSYITIRSTDSLPP